MLGAAEVATAVVTYVAPYLATLLNLTIDAAGKAAERMVEKGGEAGWDKAKAIWGKITARWGNDRIVEASSTMVAESPERADRRAMLADELAKRLQADESLLNELKDLLGGDKRVQEIISGDRAVIEHVRQRMGGPGTQSIRGGDDSWISGAEQDMS